MVLLPRKINSSFWGASTKIKPVGEISRLLTSACGPRCVDRELFLMTILFEGWDQSEEKNQLTADVGVADIVAKGQPLPLTPFQLPMESNKPGVNLNNQN